MDARCYDQPDHRPNAVLDFHARADPTVPPMVILSKFRHFVIVGDPVARRVDVGFGLLSGVVVLLGAAALTHLCPVVRRHSWKSWVATSAFVLAELARLDKEPLGLLQRAMPL